MEPEDSDALMFAAVGTGEVEEVEAALAKGADLNVQDDSGHTPLSLATIWGFENVVARLIAAGADVGHAKDDWPILCMATHWIGFGDINDKIVAKLLDAGADPLKGAPLCGCTGAPTEGAFLTAELLLRCGADPNDVGENDWLPLIQAADAGLLSMVDLLLQHGADPNRLAHDDHDGPLNAARKRGHRDVEACLLAAGAVPPESIQTDLRTAVVWDDAEAVARLLASFGGASSPLLYDAILHGGRPEVVQVLLDAGADPNYSEEDSTSVFASAVELQRAEAVELLLRYGADPFRDGGLMASAGDNGDVRTLEALLNAGVPIDADDWEGTTALMMAAHEGHVEVVRFLIERGANVNAQTLNIHPDYYGGASALIDSVKREDIPLEVARFLLDAGADVETSDAAGNTPLMWASRASLDLVRLLLERGANVNAVDNSGRTVLDHFDAEGNPEKTRLLEAAGAKRGRAGSYHNFTIVRPAPPDETV